MGPHKYLTDFQSAVRETVCFFIGHKWHYSASRRASKRGSKRLMRLTGNPYYEPVASWHFKCRRCRRRTRDWRWDPWFKHAWWAISGFFRSAWIVVDVYRPQASGPLEWLAVAIAAPAFGFEQGWAQWALTQRWPMWPIEVAGALHMRLGDWLEARHRKPEPPKPPAGHWVLGPPPTMTSSSATFTTVLNATWIPE